MDINKRLLQSKLKGHCCSQTIVSLCMEDMGKEDEELVKAMAAFYNGMGKGKICGTLAAAIAVLYVSDYKAAMESNQEEYMDWFANRFGGYDCCEIIHGDPSKRMELCPKIVLEAYVNLHKYIEQKTC